MYAVTAHHNHVLHDTASIDHNGPRAPHNSHSNHPPSMAAAPASDTHSTTTNGHPPQPPPQPQPHHQQQPPPQPPPRNPQRGLPPLKETINVVGIPSVSIENNHLVVGDAQTSSSRSYTPIKVLGDGSFGTVLLCDWHGTLPPNTPLSPMQCGQGARPEWAGKRLVAVKRMKKRWEGGWDECSRLKELESLRAIPFHENIIPLYDFFLLPASKELYFVFESMEGNLYHLIKARKGRAFAGGLISSIFRQTVAGLDHIHTHGYFHRDMKPENVLVTTVGLFDYTPVSPIAPPNAPKEKDVVAIIKLADFGLARETNSRPPYTEYVSTRWYRAPEVLLLSREYSNPVDMWALGTIMAELVNLRPLFPGQDQVDQVARICEVLGDPSDAYGCDMAGSVLGGGPWQKGIRLAREVGFQFPLTPPKDFFDLFDKSVPRSLIQCIRDLLRYDPNKRLTSRECLNHEYLRETSPRNDIPMPSGLKGSMSQSSLPMMSTHINGNSSQHSLSSHTPRNLPPSHSNSSHHHHHHAPPVPEIPRHLPQPIPVHAQNGHRNQHVAAWLSPSPQPPSSTDYPMDISVHNEPSKPYANGHANPGPPMVPEFTGRARMDSEHNRSGEPPQQGHAQPHKSKLPGLSFGSKKSKWGLGMFGGDKTHLPPVDETTALGTRKRSQSTSTDSKSIREPSPSREAHDSRELEKYKKKEAERINREAEKARRKIAEQMHREQARAVMQKRNRMIQQVVARAEDIEWSSANEQRVELAEATSKPGATGPIRKKSAGNIANSSTLGAAAGKYSSPNMEPVPSLERDHRYRDWRGNTTAERVAKARRREFDDDHSMSSSDVNSISRVSSMSFATVDSDPGPSRLRHHPSLFGISSRTSRSSLRTSFDDFSPSARSSNSFSVEGSSSLAHDFRTHLSVNPHLGGSVSPPPLHMLSLSPTLSPSLSPSPQWAIHHDGKDSGFESKTPPYLNHTLSPSSPLDLHTYLHGHHPPSPFGGQYPPRSGHTPHSAKSAINPIFKVPPLPPPPPLPPLPKDPPPNPNNMLPPFSELEAVAGGDYSPLAPMAFTIPPEE